MHAAYGTSEEEKCSTCYISESCRVSSLEETPLIQNSIDSRNYCLSSNGFVLLLTASLYSVNIVKGLVELLAGSTFLVGNSDEGFFSSSYLQHVQLVSAFPVRLGLFSTGSSNNYFVFHTAEVHCSNLG